jgi:hypothetical protein
VESITLSENGDATEKEDGVHFGGAVAGMVDEGSVHPCCGDRDRSQRDRQEYMIERFCVWLASQRRFVVTLEGNVLRFRSNETNTYNAKQ